MRKLTKPIPKPKKPIPKPKVKQAAGERSKITPQLAAVGGRGNRTKEEDRPESKWDESFINQVYEYCLLGLTGAEIAPLLGVSYTTYLHWLKTKEDLYEAALNGRERADAKVAQSLFRRATGMTLPDIYFSTFMGDVSATPYEKHIPPDANAAARWLALRQPKRWKEDQVGGVHSPEEAARLLRDQLAAISNMSTPEE